MLTVIPCSAHVRRMLSLSALLLLHKLVRETEEPRKMVASTCSSDQPSVHDKELQGTPECLNSCIFSQHKSTCLLVGERMFIYISIQDNSIIKNKFSQTHDKAMPFHAHFLIKAFRQLGIFSSQSCRKLGKFPHCDSRIINLRKLCANTILDFPLFQ